MLDMRIPVLVAAAAVLLAACSTPTPTAVPASSTTTATPTTTTSASPTPVFDKWDPKFDVARSPNAAPCAPLVVQSQECAKYLTRIVLVATDLQAELKGKPAYEKTLDLARKVVEAGAAYGNEKCREGGGTFDSCQAHAVAVTIGSLSVTTSLEAEDLTAP